VELSPYPVIGHAGSKAGPRRWCELSSTSTPMTVSGCAAAKTSPATGSPAFLRPC